MRRLRKTWAAGAETEGGYFMGFYCFKFVNIDIFIASIQSILRVILLVKWLVLP